MITQAPDGIEAARIHRTVEFSGEPGGPELPFGGSFDSPQASSGLDYLLVGPTGLERAGLGTEPTPGHDPRPP